MSDPRYGTAAEPEGDHRITIDDRAAPPGYLRVVCSRHYADGDVCKSWIAGDRRAENAARGLMRAVSKPGVTVTLYNGRGEELRVLPPPRPQSTPPSRADFRSPMSVSRLVGLDDDGDRPRHGAYRRR